MFLAAIKDGVRTDRHLCLQCAAKAGGCAPDATLQEILTQFVERHHEESEDPNRNPN